jgi:hypothetical protein
MCIYTSYVSESQLVSPVNGHSCRRITKQNIKQFGFESIEDLHKEYPNFPLMCSQYQTLIGKDPKGLKKIGLENWSKDLKEKEKLDYDKNPRVCERCNLTIPFKNRNNKFCTTSCANKREWNSEKRLKLSNTLSNKNKKSYEKPCKYCGIIFSKMKRKYCSDSCMKKYKIKDRHPLTNYRSACAFSFSVYNFPEEFNLELLEKYGWYKASNKGNNLNGISRDHMVSVRYGFDNNIDPKIISHPANCQLLPHSSNVSKYTKCSITLEDLLLRIEQWDKKYLVENMGI